MCGLGERRKVPIGIASIPAEIRTRNLLIRMSVANHLAAVTADRRYAVMKGVSVVLLHETPVLYVLLIV